MIQVPELAYNFRKNAAYNLEIGGIRILNNLCKNGLYGGLSIPNFNDNGYINKPESDGINMDPRNLTRNNTHSVVAFRYKIDSDGFGTTHSLYDFIVDWSYYDRKISDDYLERKQFVYINFREYALGTKDYSAGDVYTTVIMNYYLGDDDNYYLKCYLDGVYITTVMAYRAGDMYPVAQFEYSKTNQIDNMYVNLTDYYYSVNYPGEINDTDALEIHNMLSTTGVVAVENLNEINDYSKHDFRYSANPTMMNDGIVKDELGNTDRYISVANKPNFLSINGSEYNLGLSSKHVFGPFDPVQNGGDANKLYNYTFSIRFLYDFLDNDDINNISFSTHTIFGDTFNTNAYQFSIDVNESLSNLVEKYISKRKVIGKNSITEIQNLGEINIFNNKEMIITLHSKEFVMGGLGGFYSPRYLNKVYINKVLYGYFISTYKIRSDSQDTFFDIPNSHGSGLKVILTDYLVNTGFDYSDNSANLIYDMLHQQMWSPTEYIKMEQIKDVLARAIATDGTTKYSKLYVPKNIRFSLKALNKLKSLLGTTGPITVPPLPDEKYSSILYVNGKYSYKVNYSSYMFLSKIDIIYELLLTIETATQLRNYLGITDGVPVAAIMTNNKIINSISINNQSVMAYNDIGTVIIDNAYIEDIYNLSEDAITSLKISLGLLKREDV